MTAIPGGAPAGKLVLTYDDYVSFPEDGRRHEVIEGEHYVTPAPRPLHQIVSRNLQLALHNHVAERNLGEVLQAPIDVILDETTIVQPDLVFVAKAQITIITSRAIEGSPQLMIEILSPATARRDRVTKATIYARFGIEHYWIVDPAAKQIEVYELAGGAYDAAGVYSEGQALVTRLFSDLQLDTSRLWPEE